MIKKFILITLITAGVISLILLFENMEKEPQIKLNLEGGVSVFKNAKFIQKKDGKVIIEINSEEAVLNNNNQMSLQNITMFFPEKEFTVKAQRGIYYTDSSEFLLNGWIEVDGKNFKIYGQQAYWSPKDRTIYSDKPLKIETKRFIVEGNSGKANANLIELDKGVRAVVYVKG